MSISSACLISKLLLEEYVIAISSINCSLESNELINVIIEGKLNNAHIHVPNICICSEFPVGMGYLKCIHKEISVKYHKFSGRYERIE
jgi:predicted nucleic acid-binding Zn finger protein